MSKTKQQTKLKVTILKKGQRLPGGWLSGDRHNDLKYLLTVLAEQYDPAAQRENRSYSIHTARLIQQRLIEFKREFVPSDTAILFQLNTADTNKLGKGYYSKETLIESKKALIKAATK